MSPSTSGNKAASVRARLFNLAKEHKIDFNRLLLLYAQERFLYRLSRSRLKANLILKGGVLFYVRDELSARPTRDIDFLGLKVPNDPDRFVPYLQEILAVESDDGLEFETNSISVGRIVAAAEYEGLRVKLRARLEQAVIPLQMDVGFGDVVVPAPVKLDYPTLLTEKRFKIPAYSWESVVAEKLEAIVRFGALTSRMKDFYDLAFLLRSGKLNRKYLTRAIAGTFRNRDASLQDAVEMLSDSSLNKETAWRAFLRKNQLRETESFAEIMEVISSGLKPILQDMLHQ